MARWRVVLGVAAMLLTWAAIVEAGQDHGTWARYTNARFGYSICYPADLFVPRGESDNGDGQTFLAKEGAEFSVWGSHNAMGMTLDNVVAMRLSDNTPPFVPTYRAGKPDWRVVSGTFGEKIFYYKVMAHNDEFHSLWMAYDLSARPVYDPVVKRLSACFHSLH
ncbi:MAG: hypothetical protein HQL34_10880 [Alphaproteobacteria bacterium]|nr:hypothetical protein [Alphaproteobacteria bacterium]